MSFYPELYSLDIDQLISEFEGDPLDGAEYAAFYYIEIAYLMVSKIDSENTLYEIKKVFDYFNGYLNNHLNNDPVDISRLQAVIFALPILIVNNPYLMNSQDSRNILMKFLSHDNPSIVAESIESIINICHLFVRKDLLQEVITKLLSNPCNEVNLLASPSPHIKRALLGLMAKCYSAEDYLPVALAALENRDPIVRQTAADELGDLYKTEALPNLEKHLTDTDEEVRQAVEFAIKSINLGCQ